MEQPCLFCGGDASARDHLMYCDGRQGGRDDDDLIGPFKVPPPPPAVAPPPPKTIQRARLERDVAIDQVQDHASDSFMDAAIETIHRVALSMDLFVADDIWNARDAWPDTRDRRAMGAVVRLAVRNEWIAPTDEFQASTRRHATPMRKWRSLLRPPSMAATQAVQV